MTWRNLGRRDRRAIIIGLTLVVPVLGYRAVGPWVRSARDAEERLAQARALLAQERGLLRAIPQLEQALVVADHSVETLKPLVRQTGVYGEGSVFAAYLRHAALGAGVHLTELREESVEVSGQLRASEMTLSGEADFQGLLRYLANFDDHEALVTVESLNIRLRQAADLTQDTPETLDFSLRVRSYWVDSTDLENAGKPERLAS